MGFEKTLFGEEIFKKLQEKTTNNAFKAITSGYAEGVKEAEKYIETIKLNETLSLAINVEPYIKEDAKLQKKLKKIKEAKKQEIVRDMYEKGTKDGIKNVTAKNSDVDKVIKYYEKSKQNAPDRKTIQQALRAAQVVKTTSEKASKINFDTATFEQIQEHLINYGKITEAFNFLGKNSDLEKVVNKILKISGGKETALANFKIPVNQNPKTDNATDLIDFETLQKHLVKAIEKSIEINNTNKKAFLKEQESFATSAKDLPKEILEKELLNYETQILELDKERKGIVSNQENELKKSAKKLFSSVKRLSGSDNGKLTGSFLKRAVEYATMHEEGTGDFVNDILIKSLEDTEQKNQERITAIKERFGFLDNIKGAENVIKAIKDNGYFLDFNTKSSEMNEFDKNTKKALNLQAGYAVTKDKYDTKMGIDKEVTAVVSENEVTKKQLEEQEKVVGELEKTVKELNEVVKEKERIITTLEEKDQEFSQKQLEETQHENEILQSKNKQLQEALEVAEKENKETREQSKSKTKTSETTSTTPETTTKENIIPQGKIMYHWGELNSEKANKQKAERYADMVKGYWEGMDAVGVPYGSFGSGVYTVGDINELKGVKANDNKKDIKSFKAIDTSKLKLYATKTNEEAQQLHNLLTELQQYIIGLNSGYDYRGTYDAYDFEPKDLFSKYKNTFDKLGVTEQQLELFVDEMGELITKNSLFKEDGTVNPRATMKVGQDNISTRFMKLAGYQGIDNTGTSFDNITHGSVIFDYPDKAVIGSWKEYGEAVKFAEEQEEKAKKVAAEKPKTNQETKLKQKTETKNEPLNTGNTNTKKTIEEENEATLLLKGDVEAVTTAVDKKNEAFIEEGQIVEGTVQSEITKLELLDGQLTMITETINKLTGYFKELEELAKLGFSSKDDVADFNVLESKLKEVTQMLSNVTFDSQIDNSLSSMKENITGFNTEGLVDLSKHLKAIGQNNIAVNIQKIANALLNLKSSLNNLGNGGTTLLSDLRELTEKGEELKNIVTVLGSSKKELDKVTKKVDTVGDERKSRKQLQFENKTINDDKTSSNEEKAQIRNDSVTKARDNKISELKQKEEAFITNITNFFDSNDKLVKSQIKYVEQLTGGEKRNITSTIHYTGEKGAWSSDIVSDDYTQIQKNIENERKKTVKKVLGLQKQLIKYTEESHKFNEKQLTGAKISARERVVYGAGGIHEKKRGSARKNLDYYKNKIDQGELVLTPEEKKLYLANNKKYGEEILIGAQTSATIRGEAKEKERLQRLKEEQKLTEDIAREREHAEQNKQKGLTSKLFETQKDLLTEQSSQIKRENKLASGGSLSPKDELDYNNYSQKELSLLKEIKTIKQQITNFDEIQEKYDKQHNKYLENQLKLEQLSAITESNKASAEIENNNVRKVNIKSYSDYIDSILNKAKKIPGSDAKIITLKQTNTPGEKEEQEGVTPYKLLEKAREKNQKETTPYLELEKAIKNSAPEDLLTPFERGTEEAQKFKQAVESAYTVFRQQSAINSLNNGSFVAENVASYDEALKKVKELTAQEGILNKEIKVSKKQNTNGLTTFTAQVKTATGEVKDLTFTYSAATQQIVQQTQKVKKESMGVPKVFETIKKKIGDLGVYWTAMLFNPYDLLFRLKQLFEGIKELDKSFVEMQKVSNDSYQSLKQFQKESFDVANEVGSTSTQIQSSAADWMRLGESIKEAKESAKATNVLYNVSEFEDVSSATESLVSMSQAYKDLDKMDIVDKVNNVGNNFSISTDKLSEGMQAAASALKSQGNDFDQSLALITAANSVVQDVSQAAAGIRTISLRIAGTKEGKEQLEAFGEDVEGFVVRTESKTQQIIKDYTAVASNQFKGFDILNENGNLKSTYDIMLGISKIYKEIQEEDVKYGTNRASALVETLAGKNRSNIAASLLQSPDLLEKVYSSAQNSEGSAQAELDKYLDSVEGKTQKIANNFQKMTYNTFNSDAVKNLLDLVNGIVSGTNKALGFLKSIKGLLPAIAGLTAAIVSGKKGVNAIDINKDSKGIYKISAWARAFDEKRQYRNLLKQNNGDANGLKKAYAEYIELKTDKKLDDNEKTNKLNKLLESKKGFGDFSKKVDGIKKGTTTLEQFSQKLETCEKNTFSLSGAIKGLGSAVVNLASGFIISLLLEKFIYLIQEATTATKRAKQAADEMNTAFKESSQEIADYKTRVEELNNTINNSLTPYKDVKEARKELLSLQKEMIEKYGAEEENINLVTQAIKGQSEAYEELAQKEWEKSKKEFNDKEGATDKVNGFFSGEDYFTRTIEDNKRYSYVSTPVGKNGDSAGESYEEIKKLLSYFDNVEIDDKNDFLTISGNVEERLKTLKVIDEYLKQIPQDSFNQQFLKQYEANVKEQINSLQSLLDDDELISLMNESTLRDKILKNKEYKQAYYQLSAAGENVSSAEVEYGLDSTQVKEAKQRYIDLMSEITSSINDKEVLDYFKNVMYPDLQSEVGKWELELKFKANDKELNLLMMSIKDSFGSDEDLLYFDEKTANEQQKFAYSEFERFADKYNLTKEDAAKILAQKGVINTQGAKDFSQKVGNSFFIATGNSADETTKNNAIKWYDKLANEEDQNIANSREFQDALSKEAKKMGATTLSAKNFVKVLKSLKQTKKDTTDKKVSFEDAFEAEAFSDYKEKLLELAKAGQLTPYTLSSVKEYIDLLDKTGLTADKAFKKIKRIAEQDMTKSDWQTSLTNIRSQISTTKGLIKELKENGKTSDFTDTLIQNYPQLLQYFNNEKQLREELNKLVKEQKKDMNYAYQQMVSDSKDYYTNLKNHESDRIKQVNNSINAIIKGNETLVSVLGKAYKVDLNNFKSIADAKLKLEKELISNSAKAWSDFYKVSAETGTAIVTANSSKTIDDYMDNSGDYGKAVSKYTAEQGKQKQAALSAAKAYNKAIAMFNDVAKNVNTTLPTNAKKISGSGSSSVNKFQESINWCEKTITKLSNTISLINAKLDSTNVSLANQLKYHEQLITSQQKLVKGYSKSADTYQKDYNKKLGKLSKADQKKVEDGSYTIENFKGKSKSGKTSAAEKRYQKIQKALEARDALAQSRLELIQATNQLDEYCKTLASVRWEKASEAVDKLNDKISLLDKTVSNVSGSQVKNRIVSSSVNKQESILEKQQQVYNADVTNRDSLFSKIAKKNRKGKSSGDLLSTTGITDQKQIELIKKYNAYVKQVNEEALKLKTTEQETIVAENSAYTTKAENIQKDYENQLSLIDAQKKQLDNYIAISEAKGLIADSEVYKKEVELSNQQIKSLKSEKKQLEKLIANTRDYSDLWYELKSKIQSVTEAIDEQTIATTEAFKNQMELYKKLNESANVYLQTSISTLDWIKELSNSDNYVNQDTGVWTDEGIAVLKADMVKADIYRQSAENDLDTINKIKSEKSSYSSEAQYWTDLSEAVQQYQNDVLNANKAQQEASANYINGLKEQASLLKDLIDLKKKNLSADKTEYDYQKSISKQTKNITDLQKQLAMLGNNNSEEANAQRLSLQNQLNEANQELDDTLYDKYIERQENFLDEMYTDLTDILDELGKDIVKSIEEVKDFLSGKSGSPITGMEEILSRAGADSGILDNNTTKEMTTSLSGMSDLLSSINETAKDIYKNTEKVPTEETKTTKSVSDIIGKATNSKTNISNGRATGDYLLSQGYNGNISEKDELDLINAILDSPYASKMDKSLIESLSSISSVDQLTAKAEKDIVKALKYTQASEFIQNNATPAKKKRKEYTEYNQKIYDYTKDTLGTASVLSEKNSLKLANIMGISATKWNGTTRDSLLKTLKNAGFSKGGFVDVVKHNNDDGLATLKAGEAVLTVDQAAKFKMLAEKLGTLNASVDIAKDIVPKMPLTTNSTPSVSSTKIDNLNIEFSLPGVDNADSFIKELQTNTQLQRTVMNLVSGKMIGTNSKFNVNRL